MRLVRLVTNWFFVFTAPLWIVPVVLWEVWHQDNPEARECFITGKKCVWDA